MMREMSLCRVEKVQLGVADELRPALAIGDPTVAFSDRGHGSSVAAALRHSARPSDRVIVWSPVSTDGNDFALPLAIRFHNVAGN
jgi:hypothetical protein